MIAPCCCASNVPLTCGCLLGVSTKIEKEKREHAKQHGMIRTEITGAEIAEEMEKERRLFQLQMCEVGGVEPLHLWAAIPAVPLFLAFCTSRNVH